MDDRTKARIDECIHRSTGGPKFPLAPGWMHGLSRLKEMKCRRYDPGFTLNEADGKTAIKTLKSDFVNWGQTVAFEPLLIFQPSTIEGVKNIVKWAIRYHKRVKVIGFQHSWTNLFGDNGTVLISLFSLDIAERLPADNPPYNPGSNIFERINLENEFTGKNGSSYGILTIGGGVTNYQFQEWAREMDKSKSYSYYFPYNVVISEVTIAGTISTMCHGAGINSATLSDLLIGITFVNARGETQTITDARRQELMVAAGCFGLLGVIVSMTFKFEKMRYCSFSPSKPPLTTAIPPPLSYVLPPGMSSPSNSDQIFRDGFVSLAKNSDYCEWFWFPTSDICWVNCWNASITNRPPDVETYPSRLETWIQEKEAELGNKVFNSDLMRNKPYQKIAKVFSTYPFYVFSLSYAFVFFLFSLVVHS
jgi:hypothetical protein